MYLNGSCCCKSVTFSVESPHSYPFMHCYCSICRKTQGGGGFAINIGAVYESLEFKGEEHISSFSPMYTNHETGVYEASPGKRYFCNLCGSALWVWDPRWPELVHPYASAIDTPLPIPPERHHIFLDNKPDWVHVSVTDVDKQHDGYPNHGSLAQWHEQHGL
ncbi:GFA family protein [Halieaceae bacterium IMCC8485]|uniref:GFA family protein n=2 Tax=Candidatus Seongchinamella marina TaxID=2518990 RepID=A0ABT3SZM7_9GAMM|nr:GFA family protein [Candidatus Seongchinamella marina]